MNLFLTMCSVRVWFSTFTISHQRRFFSSTCFKIRRSSSSVQVSLFILLLRWLNHLSRHCFGAMNLPHFDWKKISLEISFQFPSPKFLKHKNNLTRLPLSVVNHPEPPIWIFGKFWACLNPEISETSDFCQNINQTNIPTLAPSYLCRFLPFLMGSFYISCNTRSEFRWIISSNACATSSAMPQSLSPHTWLNLDSTFCIVFHRRSPHPGNWTSWICRASQKSANEPPFPANDRWISQKPAPSTHKTVSLPPYLLFPTYTKQINYQN